MHRLALGVRFFSMLLCLLCVLCLTIGRGEALAAATAPTAGEVIHEAAFDADALRWLPQAAGGVAPELPDTRLTPEPGRAMIPNRHHLLLVPADRRVESVTIEALATHSLRAPDRLALAGDLMTSRGERLTARDLAAGGALAGPRATWAAATSVHRWRGYQLVAVAVPPLRSTDDDDPNAYEFLDAYAVRVVYANTTETDRLDRERLVPGEAEENRRVLERLIDNPSALSAARRQDGIEVAAPAGGFQPDKTPSLSGSPVTCLIITNSAMAASFQTLADYRTARGMPTVVATREYIAANFRNGADIQETIRLFIRDAYAKWGLQYVLLGGDSDILPPRIIYNSLYPTNGYTAIPCDLYFACLDGNWNADGDENYGQPALYEEPGDLVDFAEEVYLGRAPVSTVAAADLFVQKVITYESTAAGTPWPGRALFAAEVLFPETYVPGALIYLDGASFAHEQVTTLIEPCTDMQTLRMYETDALYPRDLPLTRASLIDSLDTGHYGIVNQIGHGYFFNMSVGDANFMTYDADNLTNGDHQFLLFGLNCASAAFDNSCLMERFLQNPNGGAVCALGSSREAFPYAVNGYQQEFFENFYCLGENRVGRLMALSRLPFLAATDANYLDRWTYENYTLLGDPALALWSAAPRSAVVTAPTSIVAGQRSLAFTVTAGGVAVPGALVCLAKAGEELVWGTTSASGQVTLAFLAPSAGTATLMVTGANLATTTRSIPVTLSSRYLKITGMPVVDNGTGGSIGNGNGVIDAGERIAFTPTYRNTGTLSASSLRGALTTTTPGVTVVTASVALSSAVAGATTSAQSPILVDFANSLPDGYPITFRSDVYSGTTHWYSEYTVPLNAPEPEVDGLDWQDVTFGNGNGRLENGERVAITVAVKNFGAGVSGTLTGRLRTISPNVVLRDTLATWTSLGLLGLGATSTPFSLALTDTAGGGAAWLLISDGYGRQVRHDFTLGRPAAPTGLEAATDLGPDTIALTWDPSTSPDVFGYNIYRSTSAGGPFTRINADVVAGVSFYADTGLPLLTPFHYRIAAVDSSRVPSPLSTVISRSTAPGEMEGFPAAFGGETSGPLAVGDIDGDHDLEVVLASNQVYAWHHDGTEVRDGDQQGLTLGQFSNFAAGSLLELAAVTMYDLDGQPGKEFIVCERAPALRIHIFKADGSELAGWPRALSGAFNWAAPAVGDIDGDQQPEIVVNALNGVIWAWNADGTEVRDGDSNATTNGVLYIRPGATWEWSRSGPTLIDLDGNGAKEIVFGTKNDASGLKRLMALRYDGTSPPGFPVVVNGPVNGDIAAGDLDRDGEMELVFSDAWRYVYVVRHDGTNYPGFPKLTPYAASAEWVSSPALADLDGDGRLEIIYTPSATGLSAKLVVISTNTAAGTSGQVWAGWPVDLPGSTEASPVVGDLDGDGEPEIVQGIGGGDVGAPYNLYVYHANGQPMSGFPITLSGPVRTSPVITDFDGDSDVDLVYGGWDFQCHVWALPFAHSPEKAYWPTYKGNMWRSGVISSPGVAAVESHIVPAAPLALDLPWPNPFNPSVSVRLYLDSTRAVKLTVHDLRGRRVRALWDDRIEAGWRTVVWDGLDDAGRATASGVYFLRADSPGAPSVTRKLVLVR
jgi:hypothetical protein